MYIYIYVCIYIYIYIHLLYTLYILLYQFTGTCLQLIHNRFLHREIMKPHVGDFSSLFHGSRVMAEFSNHQKCRTLSKTQPNSPSKHYQKKTNTTVSKHQQKTAIQKRFIHGFCPLIFCTLPMGHFTVNFHQPPGYQPTNFHIFAPAATVFPRALGSEEAPEHYSSTPDWWRFVMLI